MKKKDSHRDIVEALFMVTQIGLSLITCMSISLFIGYVLDSLFHTRFIIIIMMFIGIGASIRSLLMLTRSFGEPNQKMEDAKDGNGDEKSK